MAVTYAVNTKMGITYESSSFGDEVGGVFGELKDFTSADLEQSAYEEERKGGYRDTRFGNKIVYRVMMRSVDPSTSRGQVNELLAKYAVTQLGKVKPGTFVPGGVYYNLFVPTNYLKEFLAQVMDTGEAILYKSRTRSRNPPGKNKVFIWIKTI